MRIKCRWGRRHRQHKHGLSASSAFFQPAPHSRSPGPQAGRLRRPAGLGLPDVGRAGSCPCLASTSRTPGDPG